MVDFDDDLVRAARAVEELERVFAAYAASARAHVIVLDRLDENVRSGDGSVNEKARKLAALAQDRGLAMETGSVFAARRVQLRRRLLDVCGLPVIE
jgi:hypothetical protein